MLLLLLFFLLLLLFLLPLLPLTATDSPHGCIQCCLASERRFIGLQPSGQLQAAEPPVPCQH